jgi:hypothetical protein
MEKQVWIAPPAFLLLLQLKTIEALRNDDDFLKMILRKASLTKSSI